MGCVLVCGEGGGVGGSGCTKTGCKEVIRDYYASYYKRESGVGSL